MKPCPYRVQLRLRAPQSSYDITSCRNLKLEWWVGRAPGFDQGLFNTIYWCTIFFKIGLFDRGSTVFFKILSFFLFLIISFYFFGFFNIYIDVKNNFFKKIILVYFQIKNILKSNIYHCLNHPLIFQHRL